MWGEMHCDPAAPNGGRTAMLSGGALVILEVRKCLHSLCSFNLHQTFHRTVLQVHAG